MGEIIQLGDFPDVAEVIRQRFVDFNSSLRDYLPNSDLTTFIKGHFIYQRL